MSLVLDYSLSIIRYTFNFTGIIIEKHTKTQKQIILNRFVFFLNYSALNFELLFSLNWLYNAFSLGTTLTEITYNLPCTSMAIISTIKAIYMLIYENEISYLVRKLRTLDKQYDQLSEEKKDIVLTEKKYLDRVIKYGHWLNLYSTTAFPIMPAYITLRTYMQAKELNLLLPFLVSYPFEVTLNNYFVVFVKQIFAELTAMFTTIGVDFLFYIFCICIRIQFKLLKYDFERVVPEWRMRSQYKENEDFNRRFTRLILSHQELIGLMHILEKVFSKITFVNFATSSILICTTLFTASTAEDPAFVLSFLGFLSIMVFEIYLLCLFGNMVTESSVEVGDAIYHSQWYVTEPKIAKKLLMILRRAQKPCVITAYGFAEVNLNSFNRILSRAWSYFALLKSMYSNQRK